MILQTWFRQDHLLC